MTASRVADVVAKTKTGWGASRTNYMAELIAERLTGVSAESYTNSSMQWGSEHEAEACAAYEVETDAWVSGVGFVNHPTIRMAGASPDGLAGNDGLVEIKCPNTATHIDTLISAATPAKYLAQMQFQMACAERSWCDFVSFDPRLPEPMRLFIKRVERDPKAIDDLEKSVRDFIVELELKLADLNKIYGSAA